LNLSYKLMNKSLAKFVSLFFLTVSIFGTVGLFQSAFAQDLPEDADVDIVYVGPSDPDSDLPQDPGELFDQISILIGWAQVFFWILAVVMGIYAAYIYLTSSGDPNKVSQASNILIYVVVAIVVAILAYVIPSIVENFFV